MPSLLVRRALSSPPSGFTWVSQIALVQEASLDCKIDKCGSLRLPGIRYNLDSSFQSAFVNVLQSALVPDSELNSTGALAEDPPSCLSHILACPWKLVGITQHRHSS